MTKELNCERMLDKTHRPTKDEILERLGDTAPFWLDIHQFVDTNYEFEPELKFYAKKYGWTLRYRKSGRTLCSFFPETGAFSALIVLGKKEAEQALAMLDSFSETTRTVLEETEQLHDGRWLWIRVLGSDDVNDIIKLLKIKRKPLRRIG
jgi:hypothetical protein